MNTRLNLSDALGDSISEEKALTRIKSEPEAYERFLNFTPNDRKTILEEAVAMLPTLSQENMHC